MSHAKINSPKATVLVIDDSPEVRRYLRFMLEIDHYRVVTAGNGEEGLERLRNGCAPAVVLLDMQMPGINGLQTLQRLRQLQPEVKVIMCSSEDDPEIVHQAIVLGAQAYLVKPVRHLYLSAALDRCLIPHSPEQSNPRAASGVITMLPAQQYRPN
jgi:CheY-like chemotaxis protein